MLLNNLKGGTLPPVYPRKHDIAPSTGKMVEITPNESLREFSKKVGSGQGEVLNLGEMEKIISHFHYLSVSHVGQVGREQFITRCLDNSRPVLVPYMAKIGPVEPVTALVGTPGRNCGAHWSLIIDEIGDNYKVIEPNNPLALKEWRKQLVLDSNSFADGYKFSGKWTTKKEYDLGPKWRQKLANGLVAVIAS
jgi:hypothetical protein